MNKIRAFSQTRYLALAVLATCFFAGWANAQVYTGKFTLATETRWGGATLPAGDYSFTLDHASIDGTVHLYNGNRTVGLFPAQGQDKYYSKRPQLTVVQGTIRTLSLPRFGVTLRYLPQRPDHLTAPEERQMARIIPVSAGK
jgi:hypothetical protein